MEAGRELDVKVAEALGYEVGKFPPDYYIVVDGDIEALPHFSSKWQGMGVLVEEAKKDEIYLEYSHVLKGGYYGIACSFDDGEYQMDYSTELALPTAPHAVALAYLMARGIDI
ncbi:MULTISPECIES: hypothetical protein [Bacillales]|uniref:hypothetical protein n=1 Tax=Bacillales TaxID=1385 RepID=UPI0003475DD6|nr:MULTISPECIES: hypothetical protein [Bacillales]KMZ42528.1 hypothetical protein AC624_16130 [Bacillus sp. FJAT-27238]